MKIKNLMIVGIATIFFSCTETETITEIVEVEKIVEKPIIQTQSPLVQVDTQ